MKLCRGRGNVWREESCEIIPEVCQLAVKNLSSLELLIMFSILSLEVLLEC